MSRLRYIEDVVTLRMETDRCTGCGVCAQVCPHGVFVIRDGRAVIVDPGACMECGACARNCAFGAIRVESGVGCAAAIIASWFGGGQVACGPNPGCGNDQGDGGCC